MHEAFLVGISRYPDHTLKGVPNDLALLASALQHHGYLSSAIHVFDDSHTTCTALHTLFSQIRERYEDVKSGSCYLHVSASGALSMEAVAGGILPSDGKVLDFSTAFSFSALNQYLPIRPGIRVMVTIDT